MARKLWMRIAVAGGETPVFLVREPKGDDEAVEIDGSYNTETNVVEIGDTRAASLQKEDLFHEILHRCFKTASGDLHSEILGHSTTAKRWKHEELIVSFLSPVLYDLLVRNGWLRIPDPPARGRKRAPGGKVGDACTIPGRRKTKQPSAPRSRRTNRSDRSRSVSPTGR